MDKRTVFADKLVLPRALKVLDQGVLVGEPPNLWLMKDTDGDLKADTKDLVSDNYGRAAASIEHNANSLFWAMDNIIYTSEGDFHLRLKNGKLETIPTLPARPVGRDPWTMPDACSGTSTTRRSLRTSSPFDYYARNPNLVRTRGLYEPLHLARGLDDLAGPGDARRQPRLSRSVLPSGRQLADDSGCRHAGRLSRRSAPEGVVR